MVDKNCERKTLITLLIFFAGFGIISIGLAFAGFTCNIPSDAYQTTFVQYSTYANVSIPPSVTPVWGSIPNTSFIIYPNISVTDQIGIKSVGFLNMCYTFSAYYSPSNELIVCTDNIQSDDSSDLPLYLPCDGGQQKIIISFYVFLALSITSFLVAVIIGMCNRSQTHNFW
jgi:hypothetical protein